jgi:hypothetical protein
MIHFRKSIPREFKLLASVGLKIILVDKPSMSISILFFAWSDGLMAIGYFLLFNKGEAQKRF